MEDFLLKRDWFLDMDDIDEYLWTMDDSRFQNAIETLSQYSPRVQCAIYLYAPKRFQAGDLETFNSDDEMMARFQARKASLVAFMAPARPPSFRDEEFARKQAEIDELKARPRRNQTDIARLETECIPLREWIDQQNKVWKELQWLNARWSARNAGNALISSSNVNALTPTA